VRNVGLIAGAAAGCSVATGISRTIARSGPIRHGGSVFLLTTGRHLTPSRLRGLRVTLAPLLGHLLLLLLGCSHLTAVHLTRLTRGRSRIARILPWMLLLLLRMLRHALTSHYALLTAIGHSGSTHSRVTCRCTGWCTSVPGVLLLSPGCSRPEMVVVVSGGSHFLVGRVLPARVGARWRSDHSRPAALIRRHRSRIGGCATGLVSKVSKVSEAVEAGEVVSEEVCEVLHCCAAAVRITALLSTVHYHVARST
jgi:hypothetical protein